MKLVSNTLRECDYYRDHLEQQYEDVRIHDHDDIYEYLDEINQELKHFNVNDSEVSKMQNKFTKEEQIAPSTLDWLKEDKGRACNWFWCYLSKRNLLIDDTDPDDDPYVKLAYAVKEKETGNSQERFDIILNTFMESELNIDEVLNLIDDIKVEWNKIYDRKLIIPWFDPNNETQREWLWNYLKNSRLTNIRRHVWSPLNNKEESAAAIAYCDVMLSEYPDKIELIFLQMKKSWSQKKYRNINKDKKQVSIGMTSDTKEKLDKLAKSKDLKITDIIERMVNKEFEAEFS